MNMGLYMVLDCHEQDLSATMPLALKDSTNHGRLRLWLYHGRLRLYHGRLTAVPRRRQYCWTRSGAAGRSGAPAAAAAEED